jgi:hypothetical protein
VEIKGLNEVGGELIYIRSTQNPTTCILVKKGFHILPLRKNCSRDLTALRIKLSNEEGLRVIILRSAYLPLDDVEPPPTTQLERLLTWCRAEGTHPIIGYDANSHHNFWVEYKYQ